MFSGLCAPLACIAGVERSREEGIKGREIEAFLTPRLPLPFRRLPLRLHPFFLRAARCTYLNAKYRLILYLIRVLASTVICIDYQ